MRSVQQKLRRESMLFNLFTECKMSNLSELATSQYLKVLLWGESGAGKTCFLSKAPGPIFVMDFDNKVSSLASYLKANAPHRLAEVSYSSYVKNPKFTARPIQRMNAELDMFEKSIKDGTIKVKTIALDSLTTFADELMREIMVSNPGIKRGIDGVPALQDYLVLGMEFKKIIHRLLALDLNVVVMAHSSIEKDETTGALKGGPLLPGKLAAGLPVVFPEIYRAFVEVKDGNAIHALQCRHDGKHLTRTQIPTLPKIIPNDMGVVLSHLNK